MSENQNNKKEINKATIKGIVGGIVIANAPSVILDKLSGQKFAQFENKDGIITNIWIDQDNNGVFDTNFVNATLVHEPELENINEVHHVELENDEIVQADIIEEIESENEEIVHVEIENINIERLSFSEAFAEARNELGAGGVFEWNGNSYNTFYAQEWQNMNEEQHDEWISLYKDDKLEYYNAHIENDSIDEDAGSIENISQSNDDDDDDEDYDNDDAGEWVLV